jgi:hypothetical protein
MHMGNLPGAANFEPDIGFLVILAHDWLARILGLQVQLVTGNRGVAQGAEADVQIG